MATEDLTGALDEAGVRYELLTHARTESAVAEAEALGLAPDDVAKTLVVAIPEGYIRAVIPASERLDVGKLRAVLGGASKKVHLASEEDIARDSRPRRTSPATTPSSTSAPCRRSAALGVTRSSSTAA